MAVHLPDGATVGCSLRHVAISTSDEHLWYQSDVKASLWQPVVAYVLSIRFDHYVRRYGNSGGRNLLGFSLSCCVETTWSQ